MADRGDTHYRVSALNKWFLFSSIALLVATLWMMIDDWNAPWKPYQRQARAIEVQKTQEAIAALEEAGLFAREDELRAVVAAAEQALGAHHDELAAAEAELPDAVAFQFVREGEAKKAKAEFDWVRYNVEGQRARLGEPEAEAEKLDAALALANSTGKAKEDADLALAAVQAKVDVLRASVSDAERELAAGTSDLTLLRTRLDTLDPEAPDVRLANIMRDAPGLDFIGPSLLVKKVVLENLTFELNFTKKVRIDMCMTCHVSIDKAGWEEDEEPLRTHPRLDLYLTAKSPHPMKEVGCTICHRGSGEALHFTRADHRPTDEHEAEEWHEEHHWHKQHHWDYPMLATDYTEASCVQCHKTSMELIEHEAPKVSEGYQLFERYGCYSCHKVDWFPTKRRPGPSLKNMQAKLAADFVEPWISHPKAFRPMTWMPRLFHLENYLPDETVTVAKYGEGPEIKGQQWNETAVGAIAAYLRDRAPLQELDPIPVEGDALRGREVFRISGCLACHNLEPFEGEAAKTKDPAFEVNGPNEHGPNLRGVATKVNETWLYNWIKDPAAYWSETRMPNLRLPDQDAADIARYMVEDPDGIFHDVPDDWETTPSPVDTETLREQARWFYQKLGRGEVERRLDGENPEFRWDDTQTLSVVVGEKLVMHHGCFSCHEISGKELEMPIGTELSNWGSKTVDKLDFGFAYQMALGEDLPRLEHEYREGWIERKLHRPRSFDTKKIKNPREKARMPQFDFTEEEVKALSTFVVGLVDDEVQLAKMEPTAEELAMDKGLRVIRQKNCEACHVLEPGRVQFQDEDGFEHDVQAELLALDGETFPPTMASIEALEQYLADYEDYMEEEVEELGFRLLGSAPGLGSPGDNLFIERGDFIGLTPPRGGDFVRTVVEYYMSGIEQFDEDAEDEDDAYSYVTADPDNEGRVEDVDGEFRSYADEPFDKVRWTFAPPVLIDEGTKLQPAWFFAFLHDPVPLRQQMRVRMPTFHYDEGEAGAVADYFANKAKQDWPSEYTRKLRLALGQEPARMFVERYADVPEDERPSFLTEEIWPLSRLYGEGVGIPLEELAVLCDLKAETVALIEAGSKPDIAAKFSKVLAFGESIGFTMAGSVQPDYERIERRAPSYLAARIGQMPDGRHPATVGHAVAIEGPNCYQCHFHDGSMPDQAGTPIAWAPDLSLTRERLREDWTRDWLWGPNLIYPGTSMPANFLADPPAYQALYPDSNNAEQVQAVLDWLYNFERTPPMVSK